MVSGEERRTKNEEQETRRAREASSRSKIPLSTIIRRYNLI